MEQNRLVDFPRSVERTRVTAVATNRRHVVVLNGVVHRKLKRSATAWRMTAIEAQELAGGRRASQENRDGSDSRAVHAAEHFRGGAHDGRTSAQPRAGAARQIAARPQAQEPNHPRERVSVGCDRHPDRSAAYLDISSRHLVTD